MVKDIFLFHRRKAFTLVELTIAAICLTIILGPIIMILRSGTSSSLVGMMRIDTTQKARNILHQVYADLKMACLYLPADKREFSFEEIVTREGDSPYYNYSFYSFPIHQSYDKILENGIDNITYRVPSFITYKVENGDNPNLPTFKKLIREENFDGNITSKVLTDNLNYFEIKQIDMVVDGNKLQSYYMITLQLIDVLHENDIKDKKTGEKLRENQKDLILADFYDIVYPEYYNALWNEKGLNRNWYSILKQ